MKQVLERERPKDAISVLVRLIVREPNNKVVKSTLAESLQSPLGLECLYEELSTAATVASALAFLATSIKDHGAVDEAIRLYQRTLKLEPAAGSYALNLMHSLEVGYRINDALDVVRDFCAAAAAREGGGGLPAASLKAAAAALQGVPQYSPAHAGCLRTDPMNRSLSVRAPHRRRGFFVKRRNSELLHRVRRNYYRGCCIYHSLTQPEPFGCVWIETPLEQGPFETRLKRLLNCGA